MYGITLSLQPDTTVAMYCCIMLLLPPSSCCCSAAAASNLWKRTSYSCCLIARDFVHTLHSRSTIRNPCCRTTGSTIYHDPETTRSPSLAQLGGAGRVTWDPPTTTKWRRRMRDRDSTGRKSMERDKQRSGTQPAPTTSVRLKNSKSIIVQHPAGGKPTRT